MSENNSTQSVRKSTFIVTVILCIAVTAVVTFSLTSVLGRQYYNAVGPSVGPGRELSLPTGQPDGESPSAENNSDSLVSDLKTIDEIFSKLTVKDLDREQIKNTVLKAYVEASGDLYAEYYTQEEYEDLISEQAGAMTGIGISVSAQTLVLQQNEIKIYQVVDVYESSPAEQAGLRIGDAIALVWDSESGAYDTVDSIGYTAALAQLRGPEGTFAKFQAYRKSGGTTPSDYDLLTFEIERRQITTVSVKGRVCAVDSSVGVVRISKFDNTTPGQFTACMEDLKKLGCTSFVIDLRNNPGGLLSSVKAVLNVFLDKETLIMYTQDSQNNRTELKTPADGDSGKYKNESVCILTNENTASAAELFTANMRAYLKTPIVGEKTFGKGTMQTTYSLSGYGIPGALKLTTHFYFPPVGDGYDGIGIYPDMDVALNEECLTYSFYLLPDEIDNQLTSALTYLK